MTDFNISNYFTFMDEYVDNAVKFITDRYISLNKIKNRHIYHHTICSIKNESVNDVWNEKVIHVIWSLQLKATLKSRGLL